MKAEEVVQQVSNEWHALPPDSSIALIGYVLIELEKWLRRQYAGKQVAVPG